MRIWHGLESIGHAAIGSERRRGEEEDARKSMETLKAFNIFVLHLCPREGKR